MSFFDKMASNLGIKTDGNAEVMDVAAHARLPADHPIVDMAERAGTHGLAASDAQIRQLFGDPLSKDASVPVAPRELTPARYNWVARRAVEQMIPRIGEKHVDPRLPQELRFEMGAAIANMIDPFGKTKGSIVANRIQHETAMSGRVVGYLQASSKEIVDRGAEMLRGSGDDVLRAEFDLVPGTSRMRIPSEEVARQAWIEERLTTEHAMSKAGVLPVGAMLDAASRLDMTPTGESEAMLMAPYRHHQIVKDVMEVADEVNALSDLDLRLRFKKLGGMGHAEIPDGPERGVWIVNMMVEERQTGALSEQQQNSLSAERQAISAAIPSQRQPLQPGQVKISASIAMNAAQAAGI